MTLDFSFYNWDVISNYILKGLYFSLIPVSYTHLTLPTKRIV